MKTMNELVDELCDYCHLTDYGLNKVNTGPHNLCEGRSCSEAYDNYKEGIEEEVMEYKRVIFNKPATIVIWEDGTKTIVKCNKNDKFKKKTGFLMAYFQKTSGLTKHQSSKLLKEIVN